MRPNVTDKDRLYLLRTTSSPEVHSFLDRQPAHTKTDYQLLREALIKEFTDPESEQGLVAALETRQGRHEPPQAYYSRLRPTQTQERSWNHLRSFGNSRGKSSWESNGNSKGKRQTHPGATSPRNRRKNSQRFQADRAQTESTQEQKTSPCFDSQELMKMMMKEFFQRKEEDRKWEKKEKPDSA